MIFKKHIKLRQFVDFLKSGKYKKLGLFATEADGKALISEYMSLSGSKTYGHYQDILAEINKRKVKFTIIRNLLMLVTCRKHSHLAVKQLNQKGFQTIKTAQMWLKREYVEIQILEKRYDNYKAKVAKGETDAEKGIITNLINISNTVGYELDYDRVKMVKYFRYLDYYVGRQKELEKQSKSNKHGRGYR